MTEGFGRVLVTGGAGFIGGHLVDALLAGGAERVVVVDTFFLGHDHNLEAAREAGGDRLVPDRLGLPRRRPRPDVDLLPLPAPRLRLRAPLPPRAPAAVSPPAPRSRGGPRAGIVTLAVNAILKTFISLRFLAKAR